MPELHGKRFPNESDAYRASRNELLEAELELRKQIEHLAEMRRKLPAGGELKEDYVFEEIVDGGVKQTRLSDLFEPGKDTLVIYSFMFSADMEVPCPMCTSILDGLDSQAPHISQRVNLIVLGKSPAPRLHDWAMTRGWRHLRLLSSGKTPYNADYHAEGDKGDQLPACNVFRKTAGGIEHFYSTEMLYVPGLGEPRHMDQMWPLWNTLDITPEGRGTDWHPSLSYE